MILNDEKSMSAKAAIVQYGVLAVFERVEVIAFCMLPNRGP